MSDSKRPDDDDSVETIPVERRHAPRGTIPGLTAEVLEGDPLAPQSFEVDDVGLESFFLVGPVAASCPPGSTFRLRLRLDEKTQECRVGCVRVEQGSRTGAVMRLLPDQAEAGEFLEQILQPSHVPPGWR